MKTNRIGIIGDFNPHNPTHLFTNDAIQHAAEALSTPIETVWLATDQPTEYGRYHGLFGSPGSPYRNFARALSGIRYARENNVPFLGTCGGSQHMMIEYAEVDPRASCLFVTPLSCSLVGKTMEVTITSGSMAAVAYGAERSMEAYYCNFGLNPQYQEQLENASLAISGKDAEGEARIVELASHAFFLGTLFVPQAKSKPGVPHPLMSAFCRAASRYLPLCAAIWALSFPTGAFAWGFEGHEIVAAIARGYLTPDVRGKVDQMLAADPDTLTPHDMLSEATWADRYRSGHPETGDWHFVDIELDHPDLQSACYGFPAAGLLASQGPAHDCIVNKVSEFAKELAAPATPAAERLLALKFVLHFVGDMHQPLHDVDNHDKGGNCVLLSLGGPRAVNLHSYWDTVVVRGLGDDPQAVADMLVRRITPENKATWEKGDPQSWALEAFDIARTAVYTVGSKPGCTPDPSPVSLPPGYPEAAREIVSTQLEKAGVRLAAVLNRALGP